MSKVLVQVGAWVDEEVAPLVRELNRVPRLITVKSCGSDRLDGMVHVAFMFGSSATELDDFVSKTRPRLAGIDILAGIPFVLSNAVGLIADLAVPLQHVDVMAEAIRDACRDYDGRFYEECWTYRMAKARLLAEGHRGKTALIVEDKIDSVWESHEEAAIAGYEKFGLSKFMVHAIYQEQPVYRI